MDRTTKLLLAVIALGLWTNAVVMLVRPFPAKWQKDLADTSTAVISMERHLHSIELNVSETIPPLIVLEGNMNALGDIARGTCHNRKVCYEGTSLNSSSKISR
jgi:hypothetical protein